MEQVNTDNIQLILLTGCIDPGGMTFTKLQNPDARKAQYVEAINYYLDATSCYILFVENSGNDISMEFSNRPDRHRLEILTFSGNDYEKSLGKGFGEMLIIQYALNNSLFIKRSTFICKITGRYKVLNIHTLLNFYMLSGSKLMVWLSKELDYSDSRIFFAPAAFYNEIFVKYAGTVDDSKDVHFENALCKAVLEAIQAGYSYLPFRNKFRISGQSGTDSTFLKDSLFSWYPRNLLQMLKYRLMELKQ